jgi:hypothetical protein
MIYAGGGGDHKTPTRQLQASMPPVLDNSLHGSTSESQFSYLVIEVSKTSNLLWNGPNSKQLNKSICEN